MAPRPELNRRPTATPLASICERLTLHLEGILYRLNAPNPAGHADRFRYLTRLRHEAAKLNDAFERFHVYFGHLQRRLASNCRFDLACDNRIVDVLPGGFMGAGLCAAIHRCRHR